MPTRLESARNFAGFLTQLRDGIADLALDEQGNFNLAKVLMLVTGGGALTLLKSPVDVIREAKNGKTPEPTATA